MIWSLSYDDSLEQDYQGTMKTILLGAVARVPESYLNCKKFFEKIDVNQISYQLSTDLKLVNIVLGMTGHKSKYPCPYG